MPSSQEMDSAYFTAPKAQMGHTNNYWDFQILNNTITTVPCILSSRRSMLATQLLQVIPEMCRKHFTRSSSSCPSVTGTWSFSPSNAAFCLAVLSEPCRASAGMASDCREHDGSLAVLSTRHDVIVVAALSAVPEHQQTCKITVETKSLWNLKYIRMEICMAKLNSNYTAKYFFNNDHLQMHLPIWTSLIKTNS